MTTVERPARRTRSSWQVPRATLVTGGMVLLALLVWQLIDVLLLAFGAVVVATIMRSLGEVIDRRLPISSGWSLAIAGTVVFGVLLAFSTLLGAQISGQLATLYQQLPQQLATFGARFGIYGLDGMVSHQAQEFLQRGGVLQSVAGYTTGVVGLLASLILVLVGGAYLAADPDLYVRGCLVLVPEPTRQRVGEALEAIGRALQLWFLGQFISMVVVGVLVAGGLTALGIPSALALALLAGVGEIVPLVGPIVTAVPALLVGFSKDMATGLWVLGVYVVVQQIEAHVLLPLIQQRTVNLPPVLTLFALVAFGALFGVLGVLLSTPLTVAVYVAVKKLYVRDVLAEKTELPGEVRQVKASTRR